MGRIKALASLVLGTMLVGCASHPQPLYYWGNYQPQLYGYLKTDGNGSPEDYILGLEQTQQQAHAKGLPLPPGFDGDLGLLYLKAGKPDQARQCFVTEETDFPESKAYMDYLLGNMQAKN